MGVNSTGMSWADYWLTRGEVDVAHDYAAFVRAEAWALQRFGRPKVSETTQRLIDLLIERDTLGRAKYGTTLDRTDLTRDQWLQHMVEELLDGAGYALAAQRPEVP